MINRILAGVCTVDNRADKDVDIRYLLTDSRQLGAHPEQTLFFAIKTAKNDGANYIDELYAKGVRVFVRENAVEALQALATYVRSQFQGVVIGQNGSERVAVSAA